jgi:hypothetical protein
VDRDGSGVHEQSCAEDGEEEIGAEIVANLSF